MKDQPNTDALTAAQRGDSRSFGELFNDHYPAIHRYCMFRLRNHQDAEDVAQETFVRAWYALDSLQGERLFVPWARAIASNLCADTMRTRARRYTVPINEMDFDKPSDESLSDEPSLQQRTAELHLALARLSSRHRTLLLLRAQDGLSYKHIAAQEGTDVATVKVAIWRARQALRRQHVA